MEKKPVKGLRERLQDGENIIIGEGYMWELERRGFVSSGGFTPEIVVDYPERVTSLSEEFAMSGSDIIEAYTYYAHREKMRDIGRENQLEFLNRAALKIARRVADTKGLLMAGNICNTNSYDGRDPKSIAKCAAIFQEQIEWAVEEQADMIIAETFSSLDEAKLALDAIKKHGRGLPSVVTLAVYVVDNTLEGVPIPDALRELELMGADVVGLNCSRGPETMMPLLRQAKQVCKGPLAAIPVPFRTNESAKSFNCLKDPKTGEMAFPSNLGCCQCNRADVRRFAQEALDLGIRYIGLCCGNSPSLMREVAQVYGRKTDLDPYSPDETRNSYARSSKVDEKKKQFYFGN